MADALSSSSRPCSPTRNRQEWMVAARALPAAERLPMLRDALSAVASSADEDSVFFRKQLLRLMDESRLEAGLATREQLHAENSPVSWQEAATLKVNFHPRRHA